MNEEVQRGEIRNLSSAEWSDCSSAGGSPSARVIVVQVIGRATLALELFAAGGFAVTAIGLNLLRITRIRLGNLLPGLVVTPALVAIFAV